ncbi:probable C-mannosyltransferase DPY19L3 [Dendronephthya gigantea]|uniref:probable C-mannosyltransferase DPY19L3 n=1 Tax=Dendronephthya gigantea TaxID=151771 RepID=UPI00106ACAC9|nr:probable C-mannosyltransferase DPY19L3 [Dendronephthya gigantea]
MAFIHKVTTPENITPSGLILIILIGICFAVYIGYRYAGYMKQLHENDMWFTNIQQLEREISFRTESGLYFSYYKQLVLAPSISQGIHDLMNDNKTEHLRTINILERFNIYQEVILGVLYRLSSFKDSVEYVYFYINTIFGLHGMYMVSLFIASWLLSDSWLAGILATFFFIFNKTDTTRLSFTIPLRESFGFPFLYAQIAVVTAYFKPNLSTGKETLCLLLISILTFFFTLVWQFAQFILLLQAMAFFGVYSLKYVPSYKVRNLFIIIVGSLMSVCVLQFMNDMIIRSLALSFSLSSLIIITTKKTNAPRPSGILSNLFWLLTHIIAVFFIMFLLNALSKFLVQASSDEHIFKFLRAKFGHATQRDFDAMLYLCEMSFRMLPLDTYWRLTEGVVFPCYVLAVFLGLVLLGIAVLQEWSQESEVATSDDISTALKSKPELVYHLIQTAFFAIMAVTTLRFKFLWMPHICVVGAGIFCNQSWWRFLLSKLHMPGIKGKVLGHSLPFVLIALVLSQRLQEARNELKDLKEFYDPDTVDLMKFINGNTAKDASFSGSMQLLAGVKLCTDRHITNHPHYENKFLRLRTKDIYQIYARRTPKDVYDILKKHGTNYIILENSICYSRLDKGCKLKDILDYDNGHVIEDGEQERGLVRSHVPRFCDAIKRDDARFSRYFKKVFENRTFYVYRLVDKHR